jgi:hypothetical protein
MTSEEIKLELFKLRKQVNLSKIAKSLDPPVSPQAVHLVVEKKTISARIMKAVAAAIEKDVKYVFPNIF